jgi:proline iminopeptidase
MTIIGNHYDANNYFVPKNTIYKNMHKIKHIPTIMVEGRYDMVTPMEIAYKLSKKFDHCQLMVVKAGHATIETEITKGLVKASDYFKHKV